MRPTFALAALLAVTACAMPLPDLALSRAGMQTALQGEGKPYTWRNPDTGATGTITPERAFVLAGGVRCRDYLEHIVVGGREGAVLSTACQLADGTWRTVVVGNVH